MGRAVPALISLGLLLWIAWLLVAIDRQGQPESQPGPAGPGRPPSPSPRSLPTSRIWTKANRPLLRVITCTGRFDRATGHYRDNLILYASPAGS
jgi:hypothetical protein